MKLCDYGCGQEAIYHLKNGKWCCCERFNSCPEVRRKNSETNKIKQSGKNNAMYGKNGKLSPNWNGGISFEPYSPEFNKELKEKIKKRDNYTCRLCSEKLFLHIHHIDYNKKNSIESNLITLCRKCNGKANFNRNFWTEKFRIMLEANH